MAVMWRTPEQLVVSGFECSSTLMVNEGHNGLSRCVRTRVVGIRMAMAAHGPQRKATANWGWCLLHQVRRRSYFSIPPVRLITS